MWIRIVLCNPKQLTCYFEHDINLFMKFFRLLPIFITALFALIAQPVLATTNWLRADTHNFIIYSSGSRGQLQGFAQNVERFDALLREINHVQREEHPNRLTIYLLGEAGDVSRIVGDRRGMVAGIYLPREEGSFAIANRERAQDAYDLSGNTVLFHEYAHHFMFHQFNAPYPAWLIEGYAEYVSTTSFRPDGNWTYGAPANHRAIGLFTSRKPSIDSLLFGQSIRRSGEETDAFYGRAWLLVHMLKSDPAWAGKMTTYFSAIANGTSDRDAAAASFGDLAGLDRALDIYLRNNRFRGVRSNQPIEIDGTIEIADLDPVNSRLVELSLRRRMGKDPVPTRDALAGLATANPGNAEVWYQLALAEKALGEPERDNMADAEVLATLPDTTQRDAAATAAMAAADRALAADPDHVRANVLKARLLFETLRKSGDFGPTSWRNARAFITRANARANLDPEALAAWFESFLMQHREPPRNASEGLALAFSLAPEVPAYRANYALDLARQNQFDAAIRLVQVLAFDPHGDGQGQALLQQIIQKRDDAAANPVLQAAPAEAGN
jgi:tetratricopeptide (TPR) repeat protein